MVIPFAYFHPEIPFGDEKTYFACLVENHLEKLKELIISSDSVNNVARKALRKAPGRVEVEVEVTDIKVTSPT